MDCDPGKSKETRRRRTVASAEAAAETPVAGEGSSATSESGPDKKTQTLAIYGGTAVLVLLLGCFGVVKLTQKKTQHDPNAYFVEEDEIEYCSADDMGPI